eukprot:TRINITY_DN1181_c0_g2_i3.p1 TRINITY_DN1181_c0_g2~~TRINITY_DN1181_c0_g2_i3.p1  ORF type:complete len:129 (+),score=12.13 TRINITY_DN1181_c0_g2_i3:68-454(+)
MFRPADSSVSASVSVNSASAGCTSTLVDIGLTFGQCLRAREWHNANTWKLKVHVPMYIAFWLGALLGAWIYSMHLHHALFVPCIFIGCCALTTFAYVLYVRFYQRQPEYLGSADYEDIPLIKQANKKT